MNNLDVWDGVLLAVVGYVALTSLVRLMLARRRELVERLRQQHEAERLRQQRETRKTKNSAA